MKEIAKQPIDNKKRWPELKYGNPPNHSASAFFGFNVSIDVYKGRPAYIFWSTEIVENTEEAIVTKQVPVYAKFIE